MVEQNPEDVQRETEDRKTVGAEQYPKATKDHRTEAERKLEDAEKESEEAERAKDKAYEQYKPALEAVENAKDKCTAAEKTLEKSKERLEQIRSRLSELRRQKNQAEVEGAGSQTKLQELNSQIQAALEDEKEQDKVVSDNRNKLTTAKENLATAKRNLVGPEKVFKEAQEKDTEKKDALAKVRAEFPLKRFREEILGLYTELQFFGTTSFGYAYVVILGAMYEFAFYYHHGIYIFDYALLSDFLLSIPFVPVIAVVIGLIVVYRIAGVLVTRAVRAEYRTGVSPGVTMRLRVLFLLSPLVIVALSGYFFSVYGSYERVSLVTVPPLQ